MRQAGPGPRDGGGLDDQAAAAHTLQFFGGMRILAVVALLTCALSIGCGVLDPTFKFQGGPIAPGYSDVYAIGDLCAPARDNLCQPDWSVRIDEATTDDPAVVTVAIENSFEVRVTAHALGRTNVHVRFVDNGGSTHDMSAVFRVTPGDRVTFLPICDLAYTRASTEPYTYAGDRDVHIVAQAYDQGEPVGGEGYLPWDSGPLTYVGYFAYGESTFHTPAFSAAQVVTSPIDAGLSVPFAFVPPDALTLELSHHGNQRTGGIVQLDFSARVSGDGRPLCVDAFYRKVTTETPATCYFSPDPLTERTPYPTFRAYSDVPTGTCRIRVDLEGTTVTQTIEAPVDAP